MLDKDIFESEKVNIPDWMKETVGVDAEGADGILTGGGKTIIYVTGDMKNTGLNKCNMFTNTVVKLTIDEKYEYEGEVTAVGLKHTGYFAYEWVLDNPDLEPFEDAFFIMGADIPNELINSYKTCTFDFGFNENFEIAPASVKECDYRYRINIEK